MCSGKGIRPQATYAGKIKFKLVSYLVIKEHWGLTVLSVKIDMV